MTMIRRRRNGTLDLAVRASDQRGFVGCLLRDCMAAGRYMREVMSKVVDALLLVALGAWLGYLLVEAAL